MGRMLDRFKRQPALELEPEIKSALRDLAGWPQETHHSSGYRLRHREVTVQRDANGMVVGSIEHAFEDQYDDYHHNWGK